MKPSERIAHIMGNWNEGTTGTIRAFSDREYLHAILKYLDEQHADNEEFYGKLKRILE
jgi:hypothetical protein